MTTLIPKGTDLAKKYRNIKYLNFNAPDYAPETGGLLTPNAAVRLATPEI
jgi:hypothetical protein